MPEQYDFSELKLLPGARLDVRSDKKHIRGACELIGFHNKKTIIVSPPILNGGPVSCTTGSTLVLRFFVNHLNCACAFKSKILHMAAIPYPHLHLSVPEKVEAGEVRKSIRAKLNLPSVITNIKEIPIDANITDLSIDGAKLESFSKFGEEGDELQIQTFVELLGFSRSVEITAIIRSVNELPHAYSYGLRFKDLDEDAKILIYARVLSEIVVS